MTQTEEAQKVNHKPKIAKRSWGKRARTVLFVAAIFLFGVALGQGRISFNSQYNSRSSNLPSSLNYSSVEEIYDEIRQNYDGKLTEQQLLDGIKSGLATATNDPYTEYFNEKDSEVFEDQLNNSFSGIGAELGKDKDGNLIVVAPISGYPAEEAGLRAQDIIISVNGETTSGLGITEAVSKIRGKVGTKVKLEIIRGGSEQLDFTITRQKIEIKSVEVSISDENIATVSISTFGPDTSELMAAAAQDLKQKQVKGIILDLRGNPGGYLNAAVDVASHWLPADKIILQEKRGNVVTDTFNSTGSNELGGIPTVVLINEGSASASEIVTGALHDHKVATVVGTKSYGKGVVQQIIPLSRGGQLKVTVASWYRPNGKNINKRGIKPDKPVKLTEEDFQAGRDPQLDAALNILKTQ